MNASLDLFSSFGYLMIQLCTAYCTNRSLQLLSNNFISQLCMDLPLIVLYEIMFPHIPQL
jgi:hypothetical protein